MNKPDQGLHPNTATPETAGTQAIGRATALLREISASPHAANSLVDLAARTGLERPTAYRILRRLVAEGLAEQDPSSKTYALGPLVYELGLAAKPPRWLSHAVREATLQVAQHSGDTAFAIVQSGMDSVCIAREEGDYPVKALMMDAGRRRPMGIGSGSLALLSALPMDKALHTLHSNALRLQAQGIADVEDLLTTIRQGQQDGYVLRAATDAPEILSLAVPIVNAYGAPILAISISALKFRIEDRMEHLVGILRKAKQHIERQRATV